MGEIIKIGDLVWAKMKRFSPWPAKVWKPLENVKRPKTSKSKVLHFIYFFGSKNFAWIEEDFIKPYEKFKEPLEKICKTGQLREALLALKDYKRRRDSGEIDEDTEDFLLFNADDIHIKEEESDDPSSPSRVETIIVNATQDNPIISSTATKAILKRETVKNGAASSSTVPKKRRESVDLKSPSKTTTSLAVAKRLTSPKKLINRIRVTRNSAATPASLSRPDTEPLNVNVQTISQTLKEKKITSSTLKFGFLGLEIMGSAMAKNLINSGNTVMVWDRSALKCVEFVAAGAQQGITPSDVISGCDVTFSCFSDPNDANFGHLGVLEEVDATKGYVEIATTNSERSMDVAKAINTKGGRYLEVQVQEGKREAEEETITILCAGDRALYEECQSVFHAMGQNSFYLGDVGNASKMNIVIQMMMGSCLATLAEGMALAERAGLKYPDILEVLSVSSLACPLFLEQGQTTTDGSFPIMQPIRQMQKDINLAVSMGHSLGQPLPLAANTNEIYKHALCLGPGSRI